MIYAIRRTELWKLLKSMDLRIINYSTGCFMRFTDVHRVKYVGDRSRTDEKRRSYEYL